MLALSTAAIALVLSGRDRAAGVALVAAIGCQVHRRAAAAVPAAPADAASRRRRMLSAIGLAVLLVAASVALFGLTLPNVSGQSDLITGLSVPNLLGLAGGAGGPFSRSCTHSGSLSCSSRSTICCETETGWQAPAGRRRRSSSLKPWYVIWVFPLVAPSRSRKLRATALALSALILVTFLPTTGMFLSSHRLDLLRGQAILHVIVQENRFQRPYPPARGGWRRGVNAVRVGS